VGRILRHKPGSLVTLKNYAEVEAETATAALEKFAGSSK
jgi:hypothetical protein